MEKQDQKLKQCFRWQVIFLWLWSTNKMTTGLLTPFGVGHTVVVDLANCSTPICVGTLSKIYCTGRLIAISWHYDLQKTCPGSKMRKNASDILTEFKTIPLNVTKERFQQFCSDSFQSTNYLKEAELRDWKDNPKNLAKIHDIKLRHFAQKLHSLWKKLARKFTDEVIREPHLHPVLPVDNPFIVPGGLFQIYFYWDTYWILKGLLFSGMTETVIGILRNFALIIRTHGFIPNSGDVRLSGRSQMPLFTQMVADFYDATKNGSTLHEMLPFIEREIRWWEGHRMVTVDGHNLFQYKTASNCPRPEAYKTDFSNGVNGTYNRQFIWASITSACESGWDFSSRWFSYTGPKAGTKYSIRTNFIVPVDLNSIMCLNYATMNRLFEKVGQTEKAAHYFRKHQNLHQSVQKILWSDSVGVWLDYDIDIKSHRNRFYPSNVFPLLLRNFTTVQVKKVIDYIDRYGIVHNFPGGIPASLNTTGQQWDMPNGWAPLVHMFIESLRASQHDILIRRAVTVAQNWITTTYNGLMKPSRGFKSAMWEKYDVRYNDGRPGSGGEYSVQDGFGWTNGAVLDLLLKYGHQLHSPSHTPHTPYLLPLILVCSFALIIWFSQYVFRMGPYHYQRVVEFGDIDLTNRGRNCSQRRIEFDSSEEYLLAEYEEARSPVCDFEII